MRWRINITRLTVLPLLVAVVLLGSCGKEHSGSGTDTLQEETASTNAAQAEAETNIIFNSLFDVAFGVNDDVGLAGIGVFAQITPCHTVTIIHLSTSSNFPVRIEVSFGNAGCTGNDGHVRRGKVITEYSNRLIIPGATATTTFDGYYIDTIKVEGTQVITNSSATPTTRQFTVDINQAKLSKPNDNYTEWNSHKTIAQTEGLGTPNLPQDDIFSISGTANGRVKKGSLLVAWETNIREPLIKKFNCRWIVKGKLQTLRANTSSTSPFAATVDFGNGDCDNQAVLTVNGVPHNISLD